MTEIFVLTPLFHFPSTYNKSEIFSICRSNIEGIDLEFLPINNERIGIVLKDSKFTMESIELVYKQNAFLMNQLERVTESLNILQESYINDQKLIKNLKNETFILKKIENDLTNRLEDQIQIQRDSETKADKLIIQLQQQLTASINIIRAITHVHPNVLEDEDFLTNINCNKSSSSPSSPLLSSVQRRRVAINEDSEINNNNINLNSPILSSTSSAVSTPILINKHISQHSNNNDLSSSSPVSSSPSTPFSISFDSSSSVSTTPTTTSTPTPITAQRRPSTFNLSPTPTTAKEVDKIKHLISQYIKNYQGSNSRPYSNKNHYNFKFDSTLISTINHLHYHNQQNNNNNNNINNNSSNNNNNNNNLNNSKKIKKLARRNTLTDINSFLDRHNKKDSENETKCRRCTCTQFQAGTCQWLCSSCGHSNISHLKLNVKKSLNNQNNNQNNVILNQ